MTEGPTGNQNHDPHAAGITTPGEDMAVAVTIAAPVNDEDSRLSLYFAALIELFMQDQSPSQALCSLLARCWFWPSDCEAQEKDLFLASVLLSLGRFLQNKLACLGLDMAACIQIICCQRDVKGDKHVVTMG